MSNIYSIEVTARQKYNKNRLIYCSLTKSKNRDALNVYYVSEDQKLGTVWKKLLALFHTKPQNNVNWSVDFFFVDMLVQFRSQKKDLYVGNQMP